MKKLILGLLILGTIGCTKQPNSITNNNTYTKQATNYTCKCITTETDYYIALGGGYTRTEVTGTTTNIISDTSKTDAQRLCSQGNQPEKEINNSAYMQNSITCEIQ